MADRNAALEVRKISLDEFEVRGADTSAPTIEGYAATFDQPYDLGAFREVVDQSAFKRTLGTGPDVRFLVDHQGQPLARTKSGTLELAPDSRGLHMRAKNLDMTDPDVQRLVPKVRRGDLDEMSFAFRVPTGGDEWDDGLTTRRLTNVELNGGDVSIVTYPANPNTAGLSMRGADVRAAHFVLVERMVREIRAGNSVDMDRLKHVLDLVAAADTAVDQAQPILAEILGVANPDEDEPDSDDTAARAAEKLDSEIRGGMPLSLAVAQATRLGLRR
jgi:hypothetical protein